MKPNDSAFPQELIKTSEGLFENPSAWTDQTGLTVRAYIATKLAAGFLSNENCNYSAVAHDAVKLADALIAELNKTP